jgi:phenylalanyl-tRNA synthetase beta chain
MNVSLRWLRQYLDLPLDPETLRDLLTSLGLEVEGMHRLQSGHNGLAGIVVGRVLTCEKHPEADRLSLCTVDIAVGDPLHIVCGAPNVAAGQKVLVATPGAEVLGKDGQPFTIKKGRIRGADSEGMICAEDELGLGHDHAGILVLDPAAVTGTPAAVHLGLEEDWILEVGLTPNRSDATNHLGIARDILAALRVREGYTGELRAPDVSAFRPGSGAEVKVIVESPLACPRYSGLTITGLQVGPSPEWLRQALTAIGERPINNVVDATNYVLHELGQPLHAFDLDRISDRTIRVKTLADGTPFLALDEQERRLGPDDLMICDSQSRPLCMAGVFGGASSGVSASTTAIFLESAYFDPTHIRRSSTRHSLRTEAARIYEKGADPEITLYALQRAALLITEVAGGEVSAPVSDHYPVHVAPARITLRFERVRMLSGVPFGNDQILRIILAMGMPVLEEHADHLLVQVPGNKSEVTREVDLIEEILRVYGYDQVPEPGRMSVSVQTSPRPDPQLLREQVAERLCARGFHEAMNLSLDQSARYQQILPDRHPALVRIHNTANMHLDAMRPELLPNMLDSVRHNLNRQQPDLRLFEFGKTYRCDGDQIVECNRLLILLTGRREPEHWLNSGRAEADLYTLKAEVQAILRMLRIQGWQEQADESGLFAPGQSWRRGPKEFLRFGAVDGALLDHWGLDQTVWAADLDWDALLQAAPRKDLETSSLLRFPTMRRDLALVVDRSQPYAELETLARKTEKKLLQGVELFDVFVSEERLGPDKKSCALSFRFADPTRTLTDTEVDAVMEKLIQAYETKLGAEIRR